MPVVENPEGIVSPPKEMTLWRYMDLPKLISILESRSLFFATPATFDDPFEGSIPAATADLRDAILQETGNEHFSSEWVQQTHKDVRRFVAISSWYSSEDESVAMWKLYGRVNEAVAVRSDVSRLIRALEQTERSIVVGAVQYVSYATGLIATMTLLSPLFTKDISFRHECEVRALVQPHGTDSLDGEGIQDGGLSVPVDVEMLIEGIYVSPTAPIWFARVVESVLEKFGCKAPRRQSRLRDKPRF